jgi:hypothetical protein
MRTRRECDLFGNHRRSHLIPIPTDTIFRRIINSQLTIPTHPNNTNHRPSIRTNDIIPTTTMTEAAEDSNPAATDKNHPPATNISDTQTDRHQQPNRQETLTSFPKNYDPRTHPNLHPYLDPYPQASPQLNTNLLQPTATRSYYIEAATRNHPWNNPDFLPMMQEEWLKRSHLDEPDLWIDPHPEAFTHNPDHQIYPTTVNPASTPGEAKKWVEIQAIVANHPYNNPYQRRILQEQWWQRQWQLQPPADGHHLGGPDNQRQYNEDREIEKVNKKRKRDATKARDDL